MAYLSEDLRIRVIEAVEAGSSRVRRHGSASACRVPFGLMCGAGRAAPRPIREAETAAKRFEGAAEFLLAKVEETPDITLAELQALLKERDLSVGTGTVIAMGSASKKNRARRRAGAP